MKESGERVLPSIYLEDLYNNLKDFERMFRNYRKYSFGELNNLKDNYLTLMRADINRLSGIINENLNNNPNPILRLCKTLLINLTSFVDDNFGVKIFSLSNIFIFLGFHSSYHCFPESLK